MYEINKTVDKSCNEGMIVGIVGAIALAISTKAKDWGVDVGVETMTVIITAVGAALVRGVSNWIKNRKK